jgi:hypothetical protein
MLMQLNPKVAELLRDRRELVLGNRQPNLDATLAADRVLDSREPVV